MQLSKSIASTSYVICNQNIASSIGKNGALLLSHFINVFEYAKKTNNLHLGEWFFCKIEDVTQKIFLSRFEQENEINTLVSKGILDKKVMGVPAKRYFRFSKNAEKIVFNLANNIQFATHLQTENNQKNKSSLRVISNTVCNSLANQFVTHSQTIYNRINNNRLKEYIKNNISENSIFSLNLEKIENSENSEIKEAKNITSMENSIQAEQTGRNRIGFSFGNSTLTENQNENKPENRALNSNIVSKQNKHDLSHDYTTADVLPKNKTNKRNSSLKIVNSSNELQVINPKCEKACLITDSVFGNENGYLYFKEAFEILDATNAVKPFQFDYVDAYKLWESMITSAQALGNKGYKYVNFISAARNWARIAENNKRYDSYLKSEDVMYSYIISTFLEKFNKDTHQITAREKMFAVKLVEKIKREKSSELITQKAIDNLLFHPQFGLISHIQREKINPNKEKIFSHFNTFEAIYNNFDLIKKELVKVFNEKKQANESKTRH